MELNQSISPICPLSASRSNNAVDKLSFPGRKLNKAGIISSIQKQVCQVILRDQIQIGTVLAHKKIVTPLNGVIQYLEQQALSDESDEIDVIYQGEDYTSSSYFPTGDSFNCSFLQINDLEFPLSEAKVNRDLLTVGQRVYFVSLVNREWQLYKGQISSFNETEPSYFQITINTPPKQLEGPVFIQKDGILLLIGLFEGDLTSNENSHSLLSLSARVQSIGHIDRIMQETFGGGLEELRVGIRGSVTAEQNHYGYILEYMETSRGQNRGISILLKQGETTLESYAFNLKFLIGKKSFNVHLSSIYNKNHTDFYRAAALAFLNDLRDDPRDAPETFEFMCKKDFFRATLE